MRFARLFLACLFFGLAFNAYACLVPVASDALAMAGTCSDADDQPARQFCDNFRILGPPQQIPNPSNFGPHHAIGADFNIPSATSVLQVVDNRIYLWPIPPPSQLYLALSTTVLRI